MNHFDRFILFLLVLNCVLSTWNGNWDGALGWGAATVFLLEGAIKKEEEK
jgi:hypothetical protein